MKLEEETQSRADLHDMLERAKAELDEFKRRDGRHLAMMDKLQDEKRDLELRLQQSRSKDDDQLITLRYVDADFLFSCL